MNPDEARLIQLEEWSRRAAALAARIQTFNTTEGDCSYHPPEAEDWREWRGGCYLAALHLRYNWTLEREAELRLGKGPFYCRECELRPEHGWRARLCLECSWREYMAEEAIREGRKIGRAWARQGAA